ncbi:MAG: hypothetical protein MZV70_28690 [Desulfobacterales bacterium]|nr:hypothetical protein [Desulfobacterales bacterium]
MILMGSNAGLGQRADRARDRRRLHRPAQIPAEVFGVIPAGLPAEQWLRRPSLSGRRSMRPTTAGRSTRSSSTPAAAISRCWCRSLAENGRLAFFGATGQGLKGEYKETFFYAGTPVRDGRPLGVDAAEAGPLPQPDAARTSSPRSGFRPAAAG